ncbi:MAG: hypothetical protein KDD41_11270 [Flavobacteriales bacterium]|nr:hypothetical protein [Flavobacteriales bacterium]
MVLNIKIVTEYSLWFTLVCLLLGAVYASVLYFREDRLKEAGKWVNRVLFALRFVLVSVLAFLLLGPFVKTLFNKVEKPVIILAQDNSSSILLNKDSSYYSTEYPKQLEALKTELEEDYEVKLYTFGQTVRDDQSIDFSEKVTDLSVVFEEVNNRFYNRNVGALIVATDGIFNQGSNPVFGADYEFPVYTIALGDTALQKDIILKEALHNKITFLGNEFPVEINAEVVQCQGDQTRLTVTRQGKELFSKSYEISGKQMSINESVLLDAGEVGMQHYRVTFSSVEGEISRVNNAKDIYIEVLDGRQNVLILASAPHPDIKALKLSIESNENYKVTTQLINEFDGQFKSYSMVIVHQPTAQMQAVLQKLRDARVPALHILGNQTALAQFNALNVGLSIKNSGNKSNEIQAVAAPQFPLFTISGKTGKMISQLPPVSGPFGQYGLQTNAYVLLYQKIGSVTTESPLFVFFQDDDYKSAVFAGEGLWRWRMQDYLKNNQTESFDELINKTVQFLSVREDKSKFRIITKNEYFENEEILINAELYNESYELINEPEINIDLTEEGGARYKFAFSKTTNAYVLNAGLLPVGFYHYTATVRLGDKEYQENGRINIRKLLLEANNTVADHQLLQNIAQKFAGEMFLPTQTGQVAEKIRGNTNIASVIYEEKDLKEIINLKWIFFVLLALVSLEWFLRKRNGAY